MAHIILYCMLSLFVDISNQTIISMAQGKIRGVEQDAHISFVGVPYASIERNGRFKRAGGAPTWSGVRESRDPYCSARSEVQDCLQLDVHVPKTGKSLPILVWIKSTSGDYPPGHLVKEGIVVVTVRHRMGPVGFMCSNEDKIPGNAGIKDVVLALRWIRDNIVAFKGNPNRVVVAGQGLGAAMAETLTLSKMATGLYHGLILQSGTVLAPWAFNYNANDKTKYLQMTLNGTESILNSPITEVVAKSKELDVPYFPFGICIERSFKHEERLLSEAPFDSFVKGKIHSVPILTGYNTNEAYVFLSMLEDIKVVKKMTRDATFLLPMELQLSSEREIKSLTKRVSDMYFDDNTTMNSVLEYHRDAYFLSHIYRSANFHAVYAPVYFYQFSHSGNVGVEPETMLEKQGAAHSDELAYLFPSSDMEFDGDDAIIQRHLVQLWTNFVKQFVVGRGALLSRHWDVKTTQGIVRGYHKVNPSHFAFLGVPYARPPTGYDRFKAPSPPAVWDGIFEATHKVKCPQSETKGSENCLIINIFVPASKITNMPVLVYLHDGNYESGWGSFDPPSHFINEGLIIVTFNYRLGILGFLCLKTQYIPGNAGLKDQVAALYWIQKNILKFSGNPLDITVYGTGSGAVSIEILLLSGTSRNLFHKVILESGSVLSPSSVINDSIGMAFEAAQELGYEGEENIRDMENFFRKQPIINLVNVSVKFVPCIERNSIFSLLSNDPLKIMKSGNFHHIPMMITYSDSKEKEIITKSRQFSTVSENFKHLLPNNVALDDATREILVKVTKHFYFGNSVAQQDIVQSFIDYVNDIFMEYPVVTSAAYYAHKNDAVFLMRYVLREKGTSNIVKNNYGDIFKYVFANGIHEMNKMSDILRSIWINFIRLG
ncbi:unnamed protein product [Leptosia nina]|uniref:Carboxylesterase type B domain-containing protein n=1 Tax=Leptosia nina TaxID=320188 RepID=A0AAV1JHL8_9NEOP